MSWELIIDKIKKEENISFSIQTYNKMYDLIKMLEPYNYKITDVSSYRGPAINNCTFVKYK